MRQSVHVDGTPSVPQRQNAIEITPPVPPRNSNLRASTRLEFVITLGPAYNEFGYTEHPAKTSNFFPQKKTLLIDINVKKYPVTTQ